LLNTNIIFETVIFLLVYLFLYNISLSIIFLNFFSFISTKSKTLFSFNNFRLNFFLTTSSFIAILSMAGVPPFSGFFSKLFLLTIIQSSNFFFFYIFFFTFFFFYIFFFTLLFFGLYFYTQNLRFILTSNNKSLTYPFELTVRISTFFCSAVLFLSFLNVLGIFFLDDILLFFYWIFS